LVESENFDKSYFKTADIRNGFEVPRMHKNSCTAIYNLQKFSGGETPGPPLHTAVCVVPLRIGILAKKISPPLAHPIVKV